MCEGILGGSGTKKHSKPVQSIINTISRREFTYNPSTILQSDVRDSDGNILGKKGEVVSPLDENQCLQPMIFIDGEDERQITYVIEKIRVNRNVKVILVRGSTFEVCRILRQQHLYICGMVFHDRYGSIANRLGIQQVPAIVVQKPQEQVLTIVEETIDM